MVGIGPCIGIKKKTPGQFLRFDSFETCNTKLNVHQSKAVLYLEVLSSTVTSHTAILHQSWKNLAHVSCTTFELLTGRNIIKSTQLSSPSLSPNRDFPKTLSAHCLWVTCFCFLTQWTPLLQTYTGKNKSFLLPDALSTSRPPSLTPSPTSGSLSLLCITRIICRCSGLWSSPSSTLTDVDRNVAGNRNFGLFQKYQITQRRKTLSVNPQRSAPLMEKSNRLCPHSTCVCTPDVSLVRNLWQYASGANSSVANAAKPCVNFTFSHSENKVAALSTALVNTHC